MPTKRTTKCERRRCRTKKSGRTKRKTQKPKNNKGKRMGTHRGKRKEKRGGVPPVSITPQPPGKKEDKVSPNKKKEAPAHGMPGVDLFGGPTPPPSP
jgi:hypothetical protein